MFIVYILYSEKFDKFYIGYTRDLVKRLNYHNEGLSSYTKKYVPWELFYKEQYENKTEALKREKSLKKQKNHDFYKRLAEM